MPDNMRILVVEDDEKIASFVVKGLKQSGFTVDHAVDGEAGFYLARMNHPDVVVLDIMLPRVNGLALLKKLRQEGVAAPVIILSAMASVDDRVRGLETGADDYLSKPFAFSELLARVQALIRRSSHATEPTTLTVADITLDLIKHEATRGGTRIELQAKEFSLLEYFMRNPDRVLTKTLILERIYDYNFDPQTNVIDVLVHRLRSKVDKGFPVKRIHTLRGVGYVLKSD